MTVDIECSIYISKKHILYNKKTKLNTISAILQERGALN